MSCINIYTNETTWVIIQTLCFCILFLSMILAIMSDLVALMAGIYGWHWIYSLQIPHWLIFVSWCLSLMLGVTSWSLSRSNWCWRIICSCSSTGFCFSSAPSALSTYRVCLSLIACITWSMCTDGTEQLDGPVVSLETIWSRLLDNVCKLCIWQCLMKPVHKYSKCQINWVDTHVYCTHGAS